MSTACGVVFNVMPKAVSIRKSGGHKAKESLPGVLSLSHFQLSTSQSSLQLMLVINAGHWFCSLGMEELFNTLTHFYNVKVFICFIIFYRQLSIVLS